MKSTKLIIALTLLLVLGAAGTWGAIAGDAADNAKESAAKTREARNRSTKRSSREIDSGGTRTELSRPVALDSQKAEEPSTSSGKRPDAEPTRPSIGTEETNETKDEIRSRIRAGIGDAVDGAVEDAKASAKAKVGVAAPEVVAKNEADAATQAEILRILGGDRTGIDQTRQGHQPPRPRRLRAPAEGSVPPTNSTPLKGLFGEYFVLDKDPRQEVRGGRDPLEGKTASYTRIDNQVYFPNRSSFGGVASSDNVAVKWSGLLKVPKAGTYYFGLGNDAGGALIIDSQVVVLNDVLSWYVETWSNVELSEGWHRIEIHHIEGPQGDDKSRNMACVFQYKPTWEEAARPVPSDWLGVPLELQAPEILSLTPLKAEVGDTITVRGERFTISAPPANADGTPRVGMFDDDQTLSVYVDGLRAGDIKANGNEVTCRIPPGAGSGKVEVRRGRVPSNQVDLEVTTTFGLVLSVWDLTGYPLSLDVPTAREPDYVIHDEQPFPLTRAKFPQFDGKTILVRAEGASALYTNADIYHFSGRMPITHGYMRASSKGVTWKVDLLGQSHELDSTFMERVGVQGIEPDFWERPNGAPYLAGGTPYLNWGTTTLLAMFEFDIGAPEKNSAQTVSLLSDLPPHNRETRVSHFKPAIRLPAPPQISLGIGLTTPGFPKADEVPTVRTGGEILTLVDADALSGKESPIAFTVDDALATFRLHDDATPISLPGTDGRTRQYRRVWVTVPDMAGKGVLRARRGIVQSKPVTIDVANRGLVGMYYDFDEVLRQIPDMAGLTPHMRRIDKHLEFQNGTDFKLPFPAERFSSEWFGSIRVVEPGEYTFVIQSDDGSRLRIASQTVVEFPGLRPPGTSTGKVTLTAGWHDLHLEFFENDVLENLVVWWIPPGKTVKEFIPLSHLSTDRHQPVPNKWPVGQIPVAGH